MFCIKLHYIFPDVQDKLYSLITLTHVLLVWSFSCPLLLIKPLLNFCYCQESLWKSYQFCGLHCQHNMHYKRIIIKLHVWFMYKFSAAAIRADKYRTVRYIYRTKNSMVDTAAAYSDITYSCTFRKTVVKQSGVVLPYFYWKLMCDQICTCRYVSIHPNRHTFCLNLKTKS